LLLLAALVVASTLLAWFLSAGDQRARSVSPATTAAKRSSRSTGQRPGTAAVRVSRLVATRTTRLSKPLQDAAAAGTIDGTQALLLGGLTASDVSTNGVRILGAAAEKTLGRLPVPLHDSAAVRLGRSTYLFGGGTATGQLDQIVRVDEAGRTSVVGRLPAASSDQAAAAVGGIAYIVGGYTGTRWLDTIVAWRPSLAARVVAHLPWPLRYAAVTAVGNRLVVAGGSLQTGSASAAVLEFKPPSGRVRRIGSLPARTTHAAAAALGGTAFVIGGRGGLVGTPTDRIVAVDPRTGLVRPGGRLPTPLSDLAAVKVRRGVLIIGGRDRSDTIATLTWLAPRAVSSEAAANRTATSKATNVYAADGAAHLTGAARLARPLVYVPNSQSNTVDVIDPRTFQIVEHFAVGRLPQHVVPSHDLKTLYVTNDLGNSLTPIDPRTGRAGRPIPVADPYNMYFTPGGRYAIVVAERLARLDFRDAHSFRLHHSLPVPCRGVDHLDFSADGSYLVASCEFSGQLVKVDVRRERVLGTLALRAGAAPQDVKLAPDGRVFYVADMTAGGVWRVDGNRLRVTGFVHTGSGAHGLYVSRDSRFLYVTNRSEGSVSVLSFRTGRVVRTWHLPGGGSPDMGNVSADGRVLWLSGRWNAQVYAISTTNGRVLARIPVGLGPHGLTVWPQPGRYSLGHTGIMR
jgi:DNA-binding beta-propeller fold protein YncE